jgi:hypothetical protein
MPILAAAAEAYERAAGTGKDLIAEGGKKSN